MTLDKHSGHAPFSPPPSKPSTLIMPNNGWIMDAQTRNRLLKKYQTPVASAAGSICATLAVTPLENVKTRMQTHDFKNVSQCVRYLWRTEGPRGYVAGALPPLASVTAVRVMNFVTYDAGKAFVNDFAIRVFGVAPMENAKRPGSTPTVASILTFTTAGMFAGLVSAPIACPFELAKNVVQTSVLVSNRAQASSDAASDPSLRNKPRLGTIQAFKQIVRRHGFRGLYTGFHLHAIRDTIGSGIYFGLYDTVKQKMGTDTSLLGSSAIAAVICSTVPWFCTYPLDTRKTRAQSVLLGKSQEIGEASKAVAKSSMYKGLPIILLRTGVNNMILLSIIEYIKMRIDRLED